MPPVTPPEQLTALTFDENGDIDMDYLHLRHVSPPTDPENESVADPADSPCPSPPNTADVVDFLDYNAPSPPASSPAQSDDSYRNCVSVSPLSPLNPLLDMQSDYQIPGIQAPSPPPPATSPPPAPLHAPKLSPGFSLAPTSSSSSPVWPPSPPLLDPDHTLPTLSPPASSPIYPGVDDIPSCIDSDFPPSPPQPGTSDGGKNTAPIQEIQAIISITSSSPTISFQWPTIPEPLQRHFSVPYGRSVIDLAQVLFHPRPICTGPCCQPRLIRSKAFLDGESAVAVLQNLPTPGLSGIQRTVGTWPPGQHFDAVEVRHNGGTWRFAPWALTVWHTFVNIRDSLSVWQRAVEYFETSTDTETVTLLRSLRWDGDCAIPDASLTSIGRLATKQWLNDECISVLVYMVNLDLSGGTSYILTSLSSNFIRSAWHIFKRDGFRITRNWVTKLYDSFKAGDLERLGLCVNVIAGGGPHEQGNHWVGVVIDAPASTIYLGDSLGNPPDDEVLNMVKWFLTGVFTHNFSVRPLQSPIQPVNWSCGDFAVNMIAHQLLPEKYPLHGTHVDDAVCHRTQLFHRAFKTIRELVCLFTPFDLVQPRLPFSAGWKCVLY